MSDVQSLSDYQLALQDFLQSTLTPKRAGRFDEVLKQRTRWLTVVIADVFIDHNSSAVLRSCDACGVQDVHVIESYNEFQTNVDVALGAEKWLTLTRHRGREAPARCLEQLRSSGYRVVATSPRPGAYPIDQLPIDRPLALLFGNEKSGLDPAVIEAADLCTYIPMSGFVESFNVSVAAALCAYNLADRIRRSDVSWQLSDAEREVLRYEWTRNSVSHLEALERRFTAEWESHGRCWNPDLPPEQSGASNSTL